ncbi:MAG: UDP-N-acetyl-D-mannosaminuronic acid dehydrogenase [Proteobacteria bacterium SG_bin6]|nr:MAG: UDP-N-acetyl-D-mannosaminuronic acid dehydrogenase [Proteobacteria bacterium SG_bin6]
MHPIKNVCVVGLGYIGLPTAAVFASRGIDVLGVDINPSTVDTINRGDVHIIEPALDAIVRDVVTRGKLRASLQPEGADAFVIAVPTPFKGEDHEPDLTYIESAANAVAPVLKKGDLIVLESTSPVGATEQMAEWLAAARPDLSFPQGAGVEADIRVAHCPERVLPGKVIQELVENDRVVGGMTPPCAQRAVELYRIFVEGDCIITDARTAEMAKLCENSFRDVNIAFANEISLICDRLGIDVWELISLANRHPRVNILSPGPGVGGHCIAVDPWFIVSSAREQARLIRTAREVNDGKPEWVLARVGEAIEQVRQEGRVPRVAAYGLAFKADIDDLRESPALKIVTALAKRTDCTLVAVEPNIDALPASLGALELSAPDEAHRSADIHLLLVDHRAFRSLGRPAGIVIDTRGLWRDREASAAE